MRRRRSRGRRRQRWLSNNRRRNAFKDRYQMLAGAFSQHGIKSFLLFLFAFFIIFNIFQKRKRWCCLYSKYFFWRGQFLCRAAHIHPQMCIQHWNSLGAYIKEIWAVRQGQAYECDSPKNDCMSEGNIKMNSSALRWLHRAVSIRSVHWAGIFHFIHHLQLAAMILQDQSIPLAHTKRNTQNSHC